MYNKYAPVIKQPYPIGTPGISDDPVVPSVDRQVSVVMARGWRVRRSQLHHAFGPGVSGKRFARVVEVGSPVAEGLLLRPFRRGLGELPTNLADLRAGLADAERDEIVATADRLA